MKNYKSSETTIQTAMVDMAMSYSVSADRPDFIFLDGQKVKTYHWMDVPEYFRIKVEFLSEPDPNQGMDIKVEGGHIELADKEKVKLLRTWHDPKYEAVIEYTGYSKSKRVCVTNVYMEKRGEKVFEEKWTENAGMIVQNTDDNTVILNCSSGSQVPPDFDSLVFKVSVTQV